MNIIKNKIYLGYLFALFATILWSGNFIIARDIKETVDPISLSFYRWIVATICLLPFAIIPMIKNLHVIKNSFLYLSIISILGVSIFNTFLYIGAHTSPAINLSLISITFPIIIIIITRFYYKEKLTKNKLIGIFTVLIGILTLVSNADINTLINLQFTKGDIWVLFAAISFAIYSIMIKYKPKELGMLSFQLITFLLGTLYLIPFYLIEFDLRVFQYNNYNDYLSILYIGIFASLFAFIFWNKAVEYITAAKAGFVYYTLPIFTGFLAFIFLNEELTYIHLISMTLIILGIIITNKTKKVKEGA